MLGEGWGGPANIHLDLALAVQSIRAASEAAVRAAGLDEQSLRRAHAGLGLAGAGIKSACDGLRSKLSPFASVVIETDAYIAWLGAHQAGDGGIVILGTGSCGLAVVNGERITVGGYGANVSDEAGGQRIGREALRRALWAFDGRADKTELSAAILDRFEWDPARIVCFASRRLRLTMRSLRRWSLNMRRRKIRWPLGSSKRRQTLPYRLSNGLRMPGRLPLV